MLSFEFFEYFETRYFAERLWKAASVLNNLKFIKLVFGTKYSRMEKIIFFLRMSSTNFNWSILKYSVPFYQPSITFQVLKFS